METTEESTLRHSVESSHNNRYLSTITDIKNTSSPDIKYILIARPSSTFNYLAGQWIEVYMLSKVEQDKVLATGFSMITSDRNNNDDLEFAIKDSDCPIVRWLHSEAQVGDTIIISDAMGIMTYPNPKVLEDLTRPIVLIGGGIGVTPLLAILDKIDCMSNEDFSGSSQVWFVHQTKTKNEHIFSDRVEKVILSRKNVEAIYIVTGEKQEDRHISVTKLRDVYHVPVEKALFYISGPPRMVRKLEGELSELGVNSNHCITEKW
jgi:ferredoxin-NADP reductase